LEQNIELILSDYLKVSAFYPNGEGHYFDMDYYCNVHTPMVTELLGDTMKGMSVEQGITGLEPGSKPNYIAMGHMYFDSIEDFQNSFGPHVEKIMNDVPNYTNIEPNLIISKVTF